MTIEPGPRLGMLMRSIIVEDHMNDPADRDLCLNRVQEPDEFLVPMALHAAPNDLAVERVESGEQGSGAVSLIVMRHGAGAALFSGSPGWVRSRAWIWLFSSTESTMAWAGGST